MRERSIREPPAKEMGMSLRKNRTFQTGTDRLRVRRLRILEKGSLTFPCPSPFCSPAETPVGLPGRRSFPEGRWAVSGRRPLQPPKYAALICSLL
ncbi:hypothetical protein B4135_2248 [Caldibacillus debilis]|uniref:Uncharacterized protein n=1 Tax=Caldibacillus debilis TaxID=301148 RepID=A0A150M217_9BACI|nr:hypothetical protein B4135_2248 [Caldibacillus debilis]